jgi:hypothetical protein
MVVWAHNGHVSTSSEAGGMGSHLRTLLKERMVVFGFSFHEGSFQAHDMASPARGLVEHRAGPSPEGSLDETLSRAGHPIAAFDLRHAPETGAVADWLMARHTTRGIGAGYNDSLPDLFFVRNIIREHYDAVLFVERTTAARRNPLSSGSPFPSANDVSNLDFEEGAPGKSPPGWLASQGPVSMAYRAETSGNGARSGSRCALLRALPGRRYGEFAGTLTQRFSATSYMGARVRLRASVRVEGKDPDCRAYVWLRCAKPGYGFSSEVFYQGTEDRPITGSDWSEVELVGEVSEEAKTLDFGLALVGDGTAWIDSVSLERLESARP